MATSFPATRRAVIAGAVGAALSAPMINRGAFAFAGAPTKSCSRRAVDLVASSLVIAERFGRGSSNNNITAVLGGNFRRLLGQVWG